MESVDLASLALRAASYYAVLRATGLGWVTLWAHPIDSAARVLSSASLRRTTLAALVLVLAHRFVDAARLAGEWAGLADTHIEQLVWNSSTGAASLTTAFGLFLAIAAGASPAGPRRALTVASGFVTVAGFTLTGHTSDPQVSQFARILLPLHLALLGFWLGGVVVLSASVRSGETKTVTMLARKFSVAAIWLVPFIAAAGLAIAAAILPGMTTLREPYGIGLIGKLLTYALLLALAAGNRFMILPRIAAGTPGSRRAFLLTLRLEHALLAIALGITAGITTIWGIHTD